MVNNMDSFCQNCSLQFGNKIVFDMHNSIVHKKIITIEEEKIGSTFLKSTVTKELQTFRCEICD